MKSSLLSICPSSTCRIERDILAGAWGTSYFGVLGTSTIGGDNLRMLFIQGARSALWAAKGKQRPDRTLAWALEIERLGGHNKAAVALANKLARIAWKLWKDDRDFEIRRLPKAA